MSCRKRSVSDLDSHCGGDSRTDCERCVPSDVGTARERALYCWCSNWERWPRALVLYCIVYIYTHSGFLAPSSSGLGHSPLKAETAIRIR